jgi:hypothetical protein
MVKSRNERKKHNLIIFTVVPLDPTDPSVPVITATAARKPE